MLARAALLGSKFCRPKEREGKRANVRADGKNFEFRSFYQRRPRTGREETELGKEERGRGVRDGGERRTRTKSVRSTLPSLRKGPFINDICKTPLPLPQFELIYRIEFIQPLLCPQCGVHLWTVPNADNLLSPPLAIPHSSSHPPGQSSYAAPNLANLAKNFNVVSPDRLSNRGEGEKTWPLKTCYRRYSCHLVLAVRMVPRDGRRSLRDCESRKEGRALGVIHK